MKINNTAEIVKKIILNNSILIDFLKRDLINIASLAREIYPEIKQKNKKATIESISIAIKRLDFKQYDLNSDELKKTIEKIQITLKDNISLFTLKKSSEIPDFKKFKEDETFYLNQGSNEITLIIDEKNSNLIKEKIMHINNLSAISLKGDYRKTKGFVYTFLSKISVEGINIVDMISTNSQFTFIVKEKDALIVYEICRKIKETFKENYFLSR